jgi:hypothetical protein
MLTGDMKAKTPDSYVEGTYFTCYLDEKRGRSIVSTV